MNRETLNTFCRVINGRAYSDKELLDSGKYRVLRVGNFFTNNSWYYSDLELDEDKYCDSGDLLYAWSASFGPQIWEGEKVIYHYHIWKLEHSDKIFRRYFFHWLKSNDIVRQFGSELHGATMQHITKSVMENLQVPLPSLPEQQKIAAHLDSIQSAIDNKKQQLQQLDELVKSKFVEMFGDVKEKVLIKEICEVSGGYSFKSGDISETPGIKILQIGNVALNDVSWEVTNYLPSGFEKKHEAFLMREDDIVMALTRPIIQSLGNVKTCLVKASDLPCLLNQRVGKIRAKQGTNIRFIFYCFMQHTFTDYVQSCCKGSSQPNMSTKDIENFEIPNVNESIQNDFATFVQKIDSAKSIIKTQLSDLNELLESKMDFYFGE